MQTVRIFRSDLPDGAVINEKDFDPNLHKIWTKPVEIPERIVEIRKEIPENLNEIPETRKEILATPPKKSTQKRGS